MPRFQPALVFIFVAAMLDIMAMGIVIPVLLTLVEEFSGSNASDAIKTAMPPAAVKAWQVTITGLQSDQPEEKASARDAQIDAATRSPGLAVIAVQVLSLLGFIDDAFEVAEGYLLHRGALTGSLRLSQQQMVANDQQRRKTVMLFNPTTAAMRATPRFWTLVDAIGLTTYWKRRAILPDFQTIRP